MQEKNNSQINLVDIALFFLRHWWLFVLSIGACVGIAYYRYSKMPFLYRSTATVMIKNPANSRSGLSQYSSMVNTVSISYEKLQLRSRELMRQVVRNLDADIDYRLDIKLRDVELYDLSPVRLWLERNANGEAPGFFLEVVPRDENHIDVRTDGNVASVTLGDTVTFAGARMVFRPTLTYKQYIGKTVDIVKNSLGGAADSFLSRLHIDQSNTGSLLYISLTDFSSRRASDIVNVLVEEYNLEAIREKNRTALNTARFINERIVSIQEELEQVESGIAKFKRKERLLDAEASASNYLTESRNYSQQLTELEMQARLASYLRDHLKEAFGGFETVPSNIGLQDAGVNEAIAEYNGLILQRARFVESSSPDSPVVKQLESRLVPLRQNILDRLATYVATVEFRKKDISRREKNAL